MNDDFKRYNIIRFYQNDRRPRVMRRGLTLKQAQEHCNDPETSSKSKASLQSPKTQARYDREQLHWFDGYTEATK